MLNIGGREFGNTNVFGPPGTAPMDTKADHPPKGRDRDRIKEHGPLLVASQ